MDVANWQESSVEGKNGGWEGRVGGGGGFLEGRKAIS